MREDRRAKDARRRQQDEQQRQPVLRCLRRLGPAWFPAETAIASGRHFVQRAEERGFTHRDFVATWKEGDWEPDEDTADEWLVMGSGWELVVLFDHETPELKTVKATAA